MKAKDKKELKEKSIQDLKVALKEKRAELFNIKLEKAQNKLKNTRSLFLKRKEIARILTEIRGKELNAKNV
jgi:large subunit ribosomal protein L29